MVLVTRGLIRALPTKESGLEMPVLNLCMTKSLLNNHLDLSINSMLVIFFNEKVLGIHKKNAKHFFFLNIYFFIFIFKC